MDVWAVHRQCSAELPLRPSISLFDVPLASWSETPKVVPASEPAFDRPHIIAALTTTVACLIATVTFVIFRNVFTSNTALDLNVGAELGTQMLAFMWIAAGTALFGFFIQVGMCCGACCTCCGAGRKKVE